MIEDFSIQFNVLYLHTKVWALTPCIFLCKKFFYIQAILKICKDMKGFDIFILKYVQALI